MLTLFVWAMLVAAWVITIIYDSGSIMIWLTLTLASIAWAKISETKE